MVSKKVFKVFSALWDSVFSKNKGGPGPPGPPLDPPLGGEGEEGGARQFSFTFPIRHFKNAKETGAETRPAIDSGIVTDDSPVSYWSIFPLSLVIVTVPEVFEKVHLANRV